MSMRRREGIRGASTLGCVVALLVLVIAMHAFSKIAPVIYRASEFKEFVQIQAASGFIKEPEVIALTLYSYAVALGLPISKDQIKVTKTVEKVTVEAPYEVLVDPFFGTYKFVLKYDPTVVRLSGLTALGAALPIAGWAGTS